MSCPARMLGVLAHNLAPRERGPMWSAGACSRCLAAWGLPGRAPRINLGTPISQLTFFWFLVAPSFRAECPALLPLREAPGHAVEESLLGVSSEITNPATETYFTSPSAYRTGTARFDPPKSVRIAKFTPITFPSRLKSGPPDPPEVVAAS